jgi:predicted amidophosphoribosyltransferase
MADAARFSDLHVPGCRPVPAAGPGVCPVCHSGPPPRRLLCHSCALTTSQVSRPTRLVLPITLYQAPGPLWQLLRHYKDGPPAARGPLTVQVAAILGRFTARHLPCLAARLGGAPDVVTCVPSTRGSARPGPHPLQTAVTAVTQLARLHSPLLAPGTAAAGVAATGHNQAHDATFRVTATLAGERVLLIDDTLTTGARLQSAASALHLAGASAVAAVTIGRVIWPGRNANCRRIWAEASAAGFSFSRCCLCGGGDRADL